MDTPLYGGPLPTDNCIIEYEWCIRSTDTCHRELSIHVQHVENNGKHGQFRTNRKEREEKSTYSIALIVLIN